MIAHERTLGVIAKATLVSVGNLASALKAQGKLEEAEPLSRWALQCGGVEVWEGLFGHHHPGTVFACPVYFC